MYWRVRKYTPQEMFQQYGVHVALVISLFFNFFQLVTRPNPNKDLPASVKSDFDQFARRVTEHILDTSYINYEVATNSLINNATGELAPPVIQDLRKKGLLPASREEFQASLKSYADSKRVCAINVKEVRQGDKDAQGLIPVDVSGVVAVHSAEESYPGPVPFHFRYRIGFRPNTTQPVVGSFTEVTAHP
jgi:hypothetical protein